MIAKAFLSLAAGMLLAGCTTSLTREALTDRAPTNPGFPYYLPKQVHRIEVAYELVACDDKGIQVRQTATITESNVADQDERYLLTYRDLDSAMKTTEFSAALYPNQTLKSVGAAASDQTADVIKNVGTTVVGIAKMALGPAPSIAEAKNPPRCKGDVVTRLGLLAGLRTKVLDATLTEDERAQVVDVIGRLRESLTQRSVGILDAPARMSTPIKLSKDQQKYWLKAQETSDDEAGLSSMAEISLVGARAANDIYSVPTNRQGLVYRQPAPAKITVYAIYGEKGSTKIGEMDTAIAQLGRKFTILLENRAFEKNNVAIAFAANGALETLGYGTEASLAKATAALAGLTGQTGDFLTAKRAADQARATAAAGAELRTIETETALLKARADRIEAQRKLNALEAGTEP